MKKKLAVASTILLSLLLFISAFAFAAPATAPPVDGDVVSPIAAQSATIACLLFLAMMALFIFFGLYYKKIKISWNTEIVILVVIAVIGLVVKMVIGYNMAGHGPDMSYYLFWANRAATDLRGFYYDTNSVGAGAYPPTFIYVLAVFGGLIKAFNATGHGAELLIKMPSILADIGLAFLIYFTFRKKFVPQGRLALFALIVFNPALIACSSIWGQSDSVFVLLLAAFVILMAKKKLYPATFFMALALLMKPQAIFILPVLFIELIRRKNIKQTLISGAVGIGTFFLFAAPFQYPPQSAAIPLGGTPLWIFNLYTNAGNQITDASVNAMNFFGFLGQNWKDSSTTVINIFGFKVDYDFLGYLLMGTLFVAAFAIYLFGTMRKKVADYIDDPKSKDGNKANFVLLTAIFVAPVLMSAGMFSYGPRMHERYMIPAALLIFLVYAYTKDFRVLVTAVIFSLTNFVNVFYLMLLIYDGYPWFLVKLPLLYIISALNSIFTIYIFYVAFDIIIRGHVVGDKLVLQGKANDKTNDNLFIRIKKLKRIALQEQKAAEREAGKAIGKNDVTLSPKSTQQTKRQNNILQKKGGPNDEHDDEDGMF
jgi:Gpi18-like mannosyltransferase